MTWSGLEIMWTNIICLSQSFWTNNFFLYRCTIHWALWLCEGRIDIGLGLNAINGYHSSMVISHDIATTYVDNFFNLKTLGSLFKDLIPHYHWNASDMDQYCSTPLLPYNSNSTSKLQGSFLKSNLNNPNARPETSVVSGLAFGLFKFDYRK